jgi:integrase
VYRPKYKDKRTGRKKLSKVWWIQYSINGTKHRESSRTTVHREAVHLLNQRLQERGRGLSRRDLEKVTYEDIEELIRAHYVRKQRKSTDRLEDALTHLRRVFGGWRVIDIRPATIDSYSHDRLDQGAAPGTVNRELSALRRMLRLGVDAEIVDAVPSFKERMLEEDNVRTGFVNPDEFALIEAELPDYARPIAAVAYITGWRRGEILSRRWRHVDFGTGFLRLEPGETKNKKGRSFPLIPKLRAVLAAQHERKREIERRTDQIVDALFFVDSGKPIKTIRNCWATACRRAGFPGLLFHDLRRSAARNLVRAGISTKLAKDYLGHQTYSIFDRYAIEDAELLEEQAAKLQELYDRMEEEHVERKVVSLNG